MSDILIKAEGISKKFCKSLKRLMFYGVLDIARSMVGMSEKTGELKPGEFWANDDISFELKRGECLGLIGPNGSGKSTLFTLPGRQSKTSALVCACLRLIKKGRAFVLCILTTLPV